MPDPAPIFSLIVCTLGRRDELVRLFQSLRLQGEDDFEVILVDQNPEGWLDSLLAAETGDLKVRVVRSAKGLSRARNAGLAVARGEIIAFPDDDCWYPVGLLADVRSWMNEHREESVLTCPTRDAAGVLSNGRFLKNSRPITRRNVWYAGTSNGMFFRAAAIAAAGTFDETLGTGSGTRFGAGEETDFLLRILRTGARARFERNLFTHHDQVSRQLDEAEYVRARLYARGFGRVLRLHHYALFYVLMRAGRSLVAAGLALVSGQYRLARFKSIWAYGTLAGYAAPLSSLPLASR